MEKLDRGGGGELWAMANVSMERHLFISKSGSSPGTMCGSENIHISPMGGFFFCLNRRAVETPSLPPMTFHGVGMDVFWNHTILIYVS